MKTMLFEKTINLVKTLRETFTTRCLHNQKLPLFSWLHRNSSNFSNEEFEEFWKFLVILFKYKYKDMSLFYEAGESPLEMFDFRANKDQINDFISLLENKINKLKAFI